MNVLFLNDSTSNTNWGDRAAATALKDLVRASGGDIRWIITEDELWRSRFSEPSLDEAPLDDLRRQIASAPRWHRLARPWVPPAVLGVWRRLRAATAEPDPADLIPRDLDEFEPRARTVMRETRFGWSGLLESMAEADLAVIHGGSVDGPGVIPRSHFFLTHLLKRYFGKPVIIVNHTADLNDAALRRIAKAMYPRFDDVVFRDPISAERCRAFCSGRFAADSAFRFMPADRDPWATIARRPTYFDIWPHEACFDPARPYICVGGSSNLWADWDPPKLARSFSAIVDAVAGVYDGQIVLTASDTPDQTVFELIAAERGLPLVGVTAPIQQAVDIVGNADAYIGGRWHAGIFALSGGAPVVPIASKTFKMQALMRAAGLPEETFDVVGLGDQAALLADRLGRLLHEGESLRERLRTWAAGQAENTWDNVAYLSKVTSA